MIRGTAKKLIFIIFLILIIQFVNAEENLTIQKQAELCLIDSRLILNELIENNFSYERVNDSLNRAQNLYDAQKVLEQKGRKVDFSLILPYCKDIKDIRNLAFEAIDAYFSLKKFYYVSITPEMNASEVDVIIAEIEDEINSERYEKVSFLVNSAYDKISEVKSSYTTLNLFYTSTARGLKNFFQKNWLSVLITIFTLLILFFIYHKAIKQRIVENKIKNLGLRRKNLQELIKKTQMDYFQYGKISEGNYNIRIRQFAEFIRDIDRQIPLLKEEIMKVGKTKVEKDKVKRTQIREIKVRKSESEKAKRKVRKPKIKRVKTRKTKRKK